MAALPGNGFKVLASPQGRWLLIVGLIAFSELLIVITVLVIADKASIEDFKGILGAVSGFFLGWLAQSPMVPRAPGRSTDIPTIELPPK